MDNTHRPHCRCERCGDIEVTSEREALGPSDATACSEVFAGDEYRLLVPGEPLQKHDEGLHEEDGKWHEVGWLFSACNYVPGFMVPIRRKINPQNIQEPPDGGSDQRLVRALIEALKNPIEHVWPDADDEGIYHACYTPSANPEEMLVVVDGNALLDMLRAAMDSPNVQADLPPNG